MTRNPGSPLILCFLPYYLTYLRTLSRIRLKKKVAVVEKMSYYLDFSTGNRWADRQSTDAR